jgi:hypothetical protein
MIPLLKIKKQNIDTQIDLTRCSFQRVLAFFILLIHFTPLAWAGNNTCTYTTYKWNVLEKRAVEFKVVKHNYNSLSKKEIDQDTGCTVCEEDQELIKIPSIPSFKICRHLAEDIRNALMQLSHEGEPIFKVTGYRTGMTRGPVDNRGNRTQFSNHSFGIALDINEAQNGLYDQCLEFSPECRLRKGGKWIPGTIGTLTLDSRIVKMMKKIGFKWGGEIKGRQKDFMHFSPTGY